MPRTANRGARQRPGKRRPWCDDDWSFWINGQMAALCVAVPNGKCRIEMHINRRNRGVLFQCCPRMAHAYVEAWARKWEPELRAEYPDTAMRRAPVVPPWAARQASPQQRGEPSPQ